MLNSGLKLFDLKKCSRELFDYLQETVNVFRNNKQPIIFLKEPGFVKIKKLTQYDNLLDDSYLNREEDLDHS